MSLRIVLTFALLVGAPHSVSAQSCQVDQSQTGTNYGFWFESAVVRWQDFVPASSSLCQLEFFFMRNGNAGDVLVEIEDPLLQIVLWQGTILQAGVVSGWNTVAVQPALLLVPGQTYRINVSTNQPSVSPADRYFWRGATASSYGAGITDVESAWPGYDYAFMTSGALGPPTPTVVLQPANVIVPGGSVQVGFSAPGQGGAVFLPYVSCTPGSTQIPGTALSIPIVPDLCTDFYLNDPAGPVIFALATPGVYVGVLDGAGTSVGTVTMPAGTPPGLNIPFHIGFITLSGGQFFSASTTATLTLQ